MAAGSYASISLSCGASIGATSYNRQRGIVSGTYTTAVNVSGATYTDLTVTKRSIGSGFNGSNRSHPVQAFASKNASTRKKASINIAAQ
jgi:hypothetical protein